MELKTIIGITAGVLTSIAAIPQIIKVIRDKKAQAISSIMFFVLFAGNALWCYYGFLLNDLPIIYTNALSAILDLLMIFLNYKFSRPK